MEGTSETVVEAGKLKDVFDEVWKCYEFTTSAEAGASSESYQNSVRNGTRKGETAVRMVNELHLFSNNEELEEVATSDLRFLLLPALIGYFYSQNFTETRSKVVEKAKINYLDYLKLCRTYGMPEADVPDLKELDEPEDEATGADHAHDTKPESVMKVIPQSRNSKIQRFRQIKEIDKQLAELRKLLDLEHVDEEAQRTYYKTLLKHWIYKAIEELDSLKQELEILHYKEHLKTEKGASASAEHKPKPKSQPLRPFILTKSELQKQVYGLGYPSLPTYTVDEYYQHQVECGRFPQPGQASTSQPPPPEEDVEKDRKEDTHEDEAVQGARQWDEWKDDHRRGWGNMHNKG